MPLDPVTIGLLLAVGSTAGVISGLLGVGGGIVMVPALTLGLGYPFLDAKGLSLFAILGTGSMGVFTHDEFGNVDLRTGALLGVSGVLGNGAGYVLSLSTPEPVFRTLFGILLVAAAARIWIGDPSPPDVTDDSPTWVPVAVGLVAGVAASFFGIGGGVLFVPALALLGFPIHVAVGTSLLGVLVNGVSGSVLHYVGGHLDLVAGTAVLIAAVGGARVGALLANRLDPSRLRRVFAAALAVVGVYMAVRPWV